MSKKISVVVIMVACLTLLSSCGVGPVVKILKSYNDEPSRYWISFIKKNGINAINSDGETMLLQAVSSQDTELVKACIKSGANVNMTSTVNQFPIVLAVSIYQNREIAEQLLKAGALPQPKGKEDPLEAAIRHKDIDMVQLLLKYKAKTDYSHSEQGILSFDTPIEIIQELQEASYFPSKSDLQKIIDQYISFKSENSRDDFFTALTYLLTNKKYVSFLIENHSEIVSEQYEKRITSDEIDQALQLYRALTNAGFKPIPDIGPSIIAQADAFRSSNRLDDLLSFFTEIGMDYNTLYEGRYHKKMTLAHAILEDSGRTEYFSTGVDYVNQLIELGADTGITDSNGVSVQELYDIQATKNNGYIGEIKYQMTKMNKYSDDELSKIILGTSSYYPTDIERIACKYLLSQRESINN